MLVGAMRVDRDNFYDFVTNDFVIYEMGKIFNASEFLALDFV